MAGELTVSVPVAGPVPEGEKTIPKVQVAAAARLPGHAFWTSEKAVPVTESDRGLAAVPLELLTVTNCGTLLAPARIAGKLS